VKKVTADRPRKQRITSAKNILQAFAISVPQFFIFEPAPHAPAQQSPQLELEREIEPDNQFDSIFDQVTELAVVVAVKNPTSLVIECVRNSALQFHCRRRFPIGTVMKRIQLNVGYPQVLGQLAPQR
jgi:hypothetical protein